MDPVSFKRFAQLFKACLAEAPYSDNIYGATRAFFYQVSQPAMWSEIEDAILLRVNAHIEEYSPTLVASGDQGIEVRVNWNISGRNWEDDHQLFDVVAIQHYVPYKGMLYQLCISGVLNDAGQVTQIIDLPLNDPPPLSHCN